MSVAQAGAGNESEPNVNTIAPEFVTCYARDGSHFGPHLRRAKGYQIGPKGQERYVDNLDEAIRQLRGMPVPCWRRPNSQGIWGIVSGVEWKVLTR